MKNLEEKPIIEIIKEIGLLVLAEDDFSAFLKDGIPCKKTRFNPYGLSAKELLENKEFVAQLLENTEQLCLFLFEHEKEIDKVSFVMIIQKNLKERIEYEREHPTSPEVKKNMEMAKEKTIELLQGNDRVLIYYNWGEDRQQIESLNIEKSEGEKSERKGRITRDRLNALKQEEDFRNIVQSLITRDVENVISNKKDIGEHIRFAIEYNVLFSKYNGNYETLRTLIQSQGFQQLVDKTDRHKFVDEMARMLEKHIEEIDFDKLLLCSAIRYIEAMENQTIDSKNTTEVYKRLQTIKRHLKKNAKLTLEIEDGHEEIYSIKDLEQDMKRFIGEDEEKKYIPIEKCHELRMMLMSGDISLSEISKGMFNALSLDSRDMAELLSNYPENYIFFLRQEKAQYTKKTILRDIINIGKCSRDLLHLLVSKTDVTTDEILDLFEKEIISVEDLTSLRLSTEVPLITDRTMFEKYRKYSNIINKQDTPDQEGKTSENMQADEAKLLLERYALAYRMAELVGKSKEELNERGEQFITENEDIDTSDLVPLYALGIIPLQTAASWGGENIIEELISSESLKPADAKDLYNKGLLSVETLERLFKDCEQMSYAYQFMLVNTIFNNGTEEDQIVKDMLAQYYHIGEAMTHGYTKGSQGGEREKKKRVKTKSVVRMRDPGAKFNILASIDNGFYIESEIVDGHMIFHYPNIDGGTVLIEKMHKVSTNRQSGETEVKADNQSATYIMTEEEFRKMQSQLITDGKIDRTQLTQRWWVTRDPEHWIAHTGKSGWEEAIQERFDINPTNTRYTEEDLARFEELKLESIKSKIGEDR